MTEVDKSGNLYKKIHCSEPISQGDIFFNFPVFLPNPTSIAEIKGIDKDSLEKQVKFQVFHADIIILSQSCDLVSDPHKNRYPVDPVVVATINEIGVHSWNVVSETNSGSRPSYYLLNKDEGFMSKSHIIDFGSIHTISYNILEIFREGYGDRIRPISPILEKISHHFGNYFSRIGTEYERHKSDLKAEYEPLREKYQEEVKKFQEEQQRKKSKE